MSEYRPLEVVAAMAALGVSKAHRDAFYEAAEDYTTMTSKQLNEAMRVAGLAVDERVAVKQRLEGGSPTPTPPATPGAAITAPPASHHHELRSIPYADLREPTPLGKDAKGSFGDVHKAKYNGAWVAVKKAGAASMDPASIAKECKLLGSIPHHANVVQVLGMCTDADDRQPRIVMELCELGDVQHFLQAQPKPLTAKLVLEVCHQAACGVAHLHSAGVCHRDTRAVNFLVQSRDPLRIKVTDFGLSHLNEGGAESSGTATLIGPVAWRAPETFVFVDGKQQVSTKTDVYMFGCFMLEVITGQEPLYWVQGGGAMQVLKRGENWTKSPLDLAVEAECLDLSGVANCAAVCGTVEQLMVLIRDCLAFEPAGRPEMRHVVAALEGLLRSPVAGIDEIVHSYAGGYTPVPTSPTGRKPSRRLSQAFPLVAPAADVPLSSSSPVSTEGAATPKPSRRRTEILAQQAEAARQAEAEALRARIEREVRAEMEAAAARKAAEEEAAAAQKAAEEAAAAAQKAAEEAAAAAQKAAEEAARQEAEALAANGLLGSTVLAAVAPERFAAFELELATWLPGGVYTLLYRGSRDGMTAEAFHSLCDGKGPTLVLVRCDKGFVFGGYAGVSWESPSTWKDVASADAFILSVVGPHSPGPVRFPVKCVDKALGCKVGCGPWFTGGMAVSAKGFLPTDVFCDWSNCAIGRGGYENVLGKGNESLTGASNGKFTPVEVEVFAVTRS